MAPSSTSSSSSAAVDAVEAAVLRAVRRVCAAEGLDVRAVSSKASLVHDLGMDSFVFVELAVALEDELGAFDFPLQVWADDERRRRDLTYTIGSLVDHARRFLASRIR